MIAPRCTRDRQQLSRLLAGQLTETVMADMTQHLEDCEECRSHLELLAAGTNWWQDARQFLSDDELSPLESQGGQQPEATSDVTLSPQDLVMGFLEPADDTSFVGRLNEYDILGVIGCGGMGIVLKGLDRQLNRYVAIKVLAPHYATNAAARKRFAREAQAAAAVVHPHVLAIHSVNAQGRLPYLVMPFVAGHSLQQRLDEDGPLEIRDVLRIGMQAAQGLAAAHAQGLVHRDVKPANILLENGVQRVLLTDFGLARAIDDVSLTCSGTIAGTPQYMSPEQSRGEAVDHRTDLFSLGSVLYTLCAGRPPFRADTAMGVLRRICDEPPRALRDVNPDVPMWLEAIINKLLAKSRDGRFQSADEVARLLERCLAHLQHPTAVPLPDVISVLAAQGRPARSIKRWTALSVLAGVVMTAAIGWLIWDRSQGDDPQPNAAGVGAAANEASEQKPSAPPVSVEMARWNDGMDQSMTEIERDLWNLEQDAAASW
jgi:serine/threonine-protein kinase